MKKLSFVIIAILLILFLIFTIKIKPLFAVINGFAAKNACSCYFVGNRSLESIITKEFQTFPLTLASLEIDEKNQTVYSTVYGLVKRKARYKKGLGCQLIHGKDDYNIQFNKPEINLSDSLDWPLGSLIPNPQLSKQQSNKLNAVKEYTFNSEFQTQSILVVKNDTIVLEAYADGITKTTPQMGWSMTKSIANALIGILVKDNKINIHDKNVIEKWQDDERENITVDHLLKMNSGLDWVEIYDKPSDPNQMLWIEEDAVNFANEVPIRKQPSVEFVYSSGTSNIISGIIRDQFKNHQEYLSFPYERLFEPLGMQSVQLETDESGNYVLSSFCYATARDWAKFGLLFLKNGNWYGNQILPTNWADYSSEPSNTEKNYGAHFWLNTDNSWPDVTTKVFSANGYQGQYVFIIPAENLVVVRTGLSEEIDKNRMIKEIIEALK